MIIDSKDSREVLGLVDEYCAARRHPSLPPFTVHTHTYKNWCGTPHSAKAGCYAIYTEDGRLIYIGKASVKSCVGNRIDCHLTQEKGADPDETHRWYRRAPRLVQIIEVTEPFEAPSLEEFLQSRWPGYDQLVRNPYADRMAAAKRQAA